MNPEIFNVPDGPEILAYLQAETQSVEQLLTLAERLWDTDPARALQLRVHAARRTRELLAIKEWLDLQ